MTLRPYQQAAYQAAIDWCRHTTDPCVIEAATGAGKSHIIAALAERLHGISKGKSVICIAPSGELVKQNHAKYLATGNPASMYSASVGRKCLRHPVIFATPGTIKKASDRIASSVCAVIIDECHGITPTIKNIIDSMRSKNKFLRVIGLSATPYRLGSGYIYEIDENGRPVPEHRCRDPYYKKLIYKIQAHELIDAGYLTAPSVGMTDQQYDTSRLEIARTGSYTSDSLERAFSGQRLTVPIVQDIIRHAHNRMGVMIFAATVAHAHEVLDLLPRDQAAIVTGQTGAKERGHIIDKFRCGGLKYLVNVSVLTTGFDAPHCDLIALLRATESAALMQQMIGRGLRLHDQKQDCLVLDYAGNVDRHCPHGDLFDPDIKAHACASEPDLIEAICPVCDSANLFAKRKDWKGDCDKNGYCIDGAGDLIKTEHGFLPAHLGRRCRGQMLGEDHAYHRCSYRWSSKPCTECEGDNDIAARRCEHCGAEIIDPNEKLRLDYAKIKRDPYSVSTDKLLEWSVKEHISQKGNRCIRADFRTEYRSGSFFWMWGNQVGQKALTDRQPKTITYVKSKKNGFFKLLGVNHPEDEKPA